MNRYRFKLSNERIIGPFGLDEINELKTKKTLVGIEEIQIFPAGEWKKIDSYPEVKIIFEQDLTAISEETFNNCYLRRNWDSLLRCWDNYQKFCSYPNIPH